MKTNHRMRTILIFVVSLCLIAAMLAASVVMNNAYNSKWHLATFEGPALFAPEEQAEVSVVGVARGSTWTKVFDFNNEGLTEHNYQAFTYDFTVANNTRDQVEDFSFTLTFHRDVYLMSGWNGALEIHQHTDGGEIVEESSDPKAFFTQGASAVSSFMCTGGHARRRLHGVPPQQDHERHGGAH